MAIIKSLTLLGLLVLSSSANGFSAPKSDELQTALVSRLELLEREMVHLKAELANGKLLIHKQATEMADLKNQVSQLTPKNNQRVVGSNGRAVLPINCRELAVTGHNLDGFYIVVSPADQTKLEAVYCDFGSGTPVETTYGIIDVKTSDVHFYLQRTSSFGTPNAVVSWSTAQINVGNAINVGTGTFIAPKAGVYQFAFSGQTIPAVNDTLTIRMRKNSVAIGDAQCSNSADYMTCSLHAILRLDPNDRIDLLNVGNGTLYDNANRLSHFTGTLLEENLVLV